MRNQAHNCIDECKIDILCLYSLEICGKKLRKNRPRHCQVDKKALIRWIWAFLTGRSQQVKIGGALSNSVIPREGIPQGTRLAPLLFAILVNNLVKDGKTRVKYVDDLSVLEIIPRCSTSMLPFLARDICSYASSHGHEAKSIQM